MGKLEGLNWWSRIAVIKPPGPDSPPFASVLWFGLIIGFGALCLAALIFAPFAMSRKGMSVLQITLLMSVSIVPALVGTFFINRRVKRGTPQSPPES